MAISPNLKVTVDNVDTVVKSINQLSQQRLLVGIPDTTAGRKSGPASNAVIGYAMEFGMPEQNVPARPFLMPTIKEMNSDIIEQFRLMGVRALDGDYQGIIKMMQRLGLRVVNKVKMRIVEKIPPPLKPATVENRLRRTQAGQKILKSLRGKDLRKWGAANLTPLIDTGQLKNAITFVIRKKAAQPWKVPK
jgi:hypothetical protein